MNENKSLTQTSTNQDLSIFEDQIPDEFTVLFLDLSSSCTGYSLARVNFKNKTANFFNTGAIWFNKDWSNQAKYHYLFNAIVNYFNIVGKIDYCVAEAYMVNTKRLMGCQIGPELHGAIQVALEEVGVKYSTIYTQTWRKELGVKKDSTGDFKQPVKEKIETYVKLPDEIKSNITGTMRTLPNDVTDALGIGIGFIKKIGINSFDFSNIKFQESIDF